MKKFIKGTGMAGVVVLGLAAAMPALQAASQSDHASSGHASSDRALREGQGVVTAVSENVSAVTYWASEPDGVHVVTTVDSVVGQGDAAQHAIVRFSALLQPGQSQLISVPAAVNEKSPTLRVSRTGDQVQVERLSALSD